MSAALGGALAAQAPRPLRGLQPLPGATMIEFESLAGTAAASAGAVRVQDMRGFGTGWGGNAQLFWTPPAPVDQPVRNWPHLTISFAVPRAGSYRIVLAHTVAPDFGRVRVFLNGQQLQDVNGWAGTVAPRRAELGQRALTAGANQLVITVVGKDPASSNFFVGLDRLELQPLVPAAPAPGASGPPPAGPPAASSPDPAHPPAAPPIEEAIVVDLAGGRGRFLMTARGPEIANDCWSANWTFDLPKAAESFFYVANFDGVPGDDLLQWHHVSGEWFLITVDAPGRRAIRKSVAFNDPFKGPGRSERSAYLTGLDDRAGIVRNAPGMGVAYLRVAEPPKRLLQEALRGVSIASIDIDGDRRDEVIFYDEAAGALNVLTLAPSQPTGASTTGQLARLVSGWGANLRFATGDFDGNGRVDLLVHDASNGEVSIAAFEGGSRLGTRHRVASGWPASRWWTRAVDYDGDRHDDLLVHDRQSGAVELVRFDVPGRRVMTSRPLEPLPGPDDAFYPGYFLAARAIGPPGPRSASFLWYEKQEPGDLDPPVLELVEAWMLEGQLTTAPSCPSKVRFPTSGVVFVGDFVQDGAVPVPTTPAAPSSGAPGDAVDPRIDADAQRSLQRMLKNGIPDATAIIGAVKNQQLAGIYREDQQRPAMRAQKIGKGWWQLFDGHPPDRLARCWREPADAPPMIVMRRTVRSSPALDAALRTAWKECGL